MDGREGREKGWKGWSSGGGKEDGGAPLAGLPARNPLALSASLLVLTSGLCRRGRIEGICRSQRARQGRKKEEINFIKLQTHLPNISDAPRGTMPSTR